MDIHNVHNHNYKQNDMILSHWNST